MYFHFSSFRWLWDSCLFILIALYFNCSKLKLHMSDWQQAKFNVLLSLTSIPGKLQRKTLIRKPEKSLKKYTLFLSASVCVFTKNSRDRIKYKRFYRVENYFRQTNFLFSLARKKFASGDFRSSHQTSSSPFYLV